MKIFQYYITIKKSLLKSEKNTNFMKMFRFQMGHSFKII